MLWSVAAAYTLQSDQASILNVGVKTFLQQLLVELLRVKSSLCPLLELVHENLLLLLSGKHA